MKFFPLLAILALACCAPNGRYPISGEVCGSDDPVLSMNAADGLVPPPS